VEKKQKNKKNEAEGTRKKGEGTEKAKVRLYCKTVYSYNCNLIVLPPAV
jgi:hypothetical protein